MAQVKHPRERRSKQLKLRLCTWGGARAGAGRKPGKTRPTPHRARPALASRHPVHVTLKTDGALPSLRSKRLYGEVKEAVRQGKERQGFRVVHFSVQPHHLHLIVEAGGAGALSQGIRGLSVRLARRINVLLGRRGRLFVDRYFLRVLRSPRQTRAALMYVLLNARRHAQQRGQRLAWNWVDGCSSGPWFDGWKGGQARPEEEPPVAAPRTWLLAVGWRRHGPIPKNAVPGEPSPRG
jgi:REP element-mobilizing transposase RayT